MESHWLWFPTLYYEKGSVNCWVIHSLFSLILQNRTMTRRTLVCPIKIKHLILIQGFPLYLYKLPFSYVPSLSSLSPEAVLCPPGQIPLPLSLAPFLYPLSLPFVPLGWINLICAENMVWGSWGNTIPFTALLPSSLFLKQTFSINLELSVLAPVFGLKAHL